MKDKILIFIMGLLVGAIITASGFVIYDKTNVNNNQMPRGEGMQMMGMPNGETPPEPPNGFKNNGTEQEQSNETKNDSTKQKQSNSSKKDANKQEQSQKSNSSTNSATN